MQKLDRKTYTKMTELLNKELDTVRAILELASDTDGANFSDMNQWNERHDQERDIENAIKDLESAYSKRNWTAADFAKRELITSNTD